MDALVVPVRHLFSWKRVESNSRPGEYVYENLLTEERQAWFPVEAAKASTGAVGASVPAGKSKNQAALEKLKAKRAAEKEKLDNTPPPAGWIKVESNSRPGEFVYENSQTKERQAWFPDAPCISEAEIEKQNLKAKNIAALKARKAAADATRAAEATAPLPDGWTRVESRSRPGEFVYENKVTGERQAWLPTAAATSVSLCVINADGVSFTAVCFRVSVACCRSYAMVCEPDLHLACALFELRCSKITHGVLLDR